MATLTANAPATTLQTDIERVFNLQQQHQYEVGKTTAKQRIAQLNKLHDAIWRYRDDFKEALHKDFKRHPSEVDLADLYPVISEIKHAKRDLRRWMSPQKVPTPISLMGSKSWIHYEPKGVVLIISPWNFPVNLTLGPLVSAIAAGNCVMLKPSEHTPHTSATMKKLVQEIFDEKEVAIFEGGIEASQKLLELPFNHIFFTGAPSIGKIVMAAAAKHLTSVTLELGGKSPTIIDKTADMKAAAKRIAWGKFFNNGQICIAPDYVFVHESRKEEFIDLMKQNVKTFYGENAQESEDYSRIVNNRHFNRIKGYLENSLEKGAKIEMGGKMDGSEDYIEPTMVSNVDKDSDLMQMEIFGPVLPINTFTDLQEPIDYVNKGEKPLALYIFSKNEKNINRVINNTRAGGTCINNNAIHYNNNELPFGGSNNSGIGKGHGWFGFEGFSNARAVYKQILPGSIEFLMPPYNNLKQKMMDLTLKWF